MQEHGARAREVTSLLVREGIEACGRIAALGKDVDAKLFKIGDRVAYMTATLSSKKNDTYAEYTTADIVCVVSVIAVAVVGLNSTRRCTFQTTWTTALRAVPWFKGSQRTTSPTIRTRCSEGTPCSYRSGVCDGARASRITIAMLCLH